MPEGISAEDLVHNIMETLSDGVSRPKAGSFFEDQNSSSVSSQLNRIFGRQKPLHQILGGGKSADVLLWRNKKISAGVLAGATAVWVLFEWLNYHFLSLICFALIFGMIAQFVLSNASGLLNRSLDVPRLVIPDELFINVAKTTSLQVNRGLGFIQDVARGRDIKQFFIVVAALFAVAVISSWCNFMTILFLGFVGAHTLPVLYERYEDQVDGFVYNVLGQVQGHYRKLDTGFLGKISKGKFMGKKND